VTPPEVHILRVCIAHYGAILPPAVMSSEPTTIGNPLFSFDGF